MSRGDRVPTVPAEPAARPFEEILQAYLPLVRKVVWQCLRHKPANVETGELLSSGIDGLVDALRKYDSRKTTATFATYARFRIRGAVLDHLRSLDWVSRSVRQKARLVERTYRELEAELCRPANDEEAAEKAGMSLEEFHNLLSDVGELRMLPFNDAGFGTGEEQLNLERYVKSPDGDPLEALLRTERAELLAEAIRLLSEKERTVITLYYREGCTMREVGVALGLTESRVSQLHSQALFRLRELLHSPMTSSINGKKGAGHLPGGVLPITTRRVQSGKTRQSRSRPG